MEAYPDATPESDVNNALAAAMADHGEGRLPEAAAKYQAILEKWPGCAGAFHGLAVLGWQQGRLQEAAAAIARAVVLMPGDWRYHLTDGLVAMARHRPDEAADAFRCAADLRPDAVETWIGLAGAYQALGKTAGAVFAYEEARLRAPGNIEVLNNLAVALQAAGRQAEAADLCRVALSIRPDFLPARNNLANALVGLGRAEEAALLLKQALESSPGNAELWFNYGNALAAQQAGSEALEAYRAALRLDPQNLRAAVNLANTHRARGELQAAISGYRQAIAADPQFVDAYCNLGAALLNSGDVDGAIATLDEAIRLRPDASTAYNNLGNALKDAGRLDDAVAAYRKAVALAPEDPEPHSNLVYALSFHPGYSDMDILHEALHWAAAHATRKMRSPPSGRDADPERRLRIGYVSPDFRNHCQSLFTVPLFSNHDHDRFGIYCYAQLAAPDALSRRLAAYADVWRPIYGMSDDDVDALIREDGIDILVDLTMHMSNGRPRLFAGKPAPLQVAWLAYPGTTGQPAMDYRLTDPWLDPPGETDERYSERSLRLPATFWCYDPLTDAQPVGSLPALAAGQVTFGCLNNFCKVSEASLELWGRVLALVPGSRLILLAQPGSHRERVLESLARHSIGAGRVEFVPFRPRDQYLETYNRIDICLDTLPYNGHTTSLDAYWMGVPVVTRVGATIAGRAGWSQLNNLGLSRLAAFDDATFVKTAVELASDLDALAALRQELRSRMAASALMDGKRFAAAMENVYRAIWKEWCERAGEGGR